MAAPFVSYLLSARKEGESAHFELQYPSTTGESEDLLLERVFPSIAKEEDWTVFHLGRRMEMEITKRSKRRQTVIDPQELQVKAIELYVYEMVDDPDKGCGWEMMGEDLMVALLEPNTIQLIDDSDQTDLGTISPHFDLEFTELEECFAAVLCENGNILGFRFQNVEDEISFLLKLEEMCQKLEKSKQAKAAEANISRYIGSQLTCLSVIRGDIALCMCTTVEYVYPFKALLESLIDDYVAAPTEETLKSIFTAVNELKLPEGQGSVEATLFDKTFNLNFPKLVVKDQTLPTNLSGLILNFKERTASIYNAVISEKRVVFVGTHSASEICDAVLSAAMLIAPVFGYIKECSFPLTSTGCRFQHGLKYIAGVFDPDLKKASQHWDLLCNIDDGTVTWNSSVDGTFIQEAKEQEPFFKKIHDKIFLGCGEVTAQKALQQYTRRFVDAAVGRGYFQTADEASAFSANIKRRTLFWSASKACERWEASIDSRTVKDPAVDKAIQQFVFSTSLEEQHILEIFAKLKGAASTPEKIEEIRTSIRHYDALNYIACALMHSSPKVREEARLYLYTMKYMGKDDTELNPMFKLVYARLMVVKAD